MDPFARHLKTGETFMDPFRKMPAIFKLGQTIWTVLSPANVALFCFKLKYRRKKLRCGLGRRPLDFRISMRDINK